MIERQDGFSHFDVYKETTPCYDRSIMIAQGTVHLTEGEVKQALLEFVERQGFTRLYTHDDALGENVKIEQQKSWLPPSGGHRGGVSDGSEAVFYTAVVQVEAKKL